MNELLSILPENHPLQSPTVLSFSKYFPVFGSPTATIEVVGNTGWVSSEKAALHESFRALTLGIETAKPAEWY